MSSYYPRVGAHLPIGKGLKFPADEAVRLGLEALQIFVRNPRGSGARKWTDEEVNYFRQTLAEHDISPLVVHIPYTVNPAALREDLYEFAREIVSQDLQRCQLLQAEYLVLHPGSYTSSSLKEGIDRVASLLNRVLETDTGSTAILLETMAGQGTELGKNFEELSLIINQIERAERVGICFDTCHTFAGGYMWQDPEHMSNLLKDLDNSCGLEKVKLVHANDSEKEAGSHRDRHAAIGQGNIGEEGFQALINEPFFQERPFILETPVEGIAADIQALKQLRAKNHPR